MSSRLLEVKVWLAALGKGDWLTLRVSLLLISRFSSCSSCSFRAENKRKMFLTIVHGVAHTQALVQALRSHPLVILMAEGSWLHLPVSFQIAED